MNRRHPFAARLAWAAVQDLVRPGVLILSYVVLEPRLCRLVGHQEVTVATPEVVTLCVRCGRGR